MKQIFGLIGIIIGSAALLLSIVHFIVGPFSTPQAETTSEQNSLKQLAINLVFDREEQTSPTVQQNSWSADRITLLIIALSGGLALLMGMMSFIQREPWRLALGAATLGAYAISFQFVAMYAMLVLAIIVVVVLVSQFIQGLDA